MTPLRILAVACLITACGRDRSQRATDSMPSDTLTPRPDTTASAIPRDSSAVVPADSTALTGSRITVERVVINGVLWGASNDAVRQILGPPRSTSTVWEEALGDSATVLQYPGLNVRLVERRVVSVHCTAQTCITGDAVRVGATRGEVEQVYGKAREEKAGPDGQLAYPFTTDDACALRFELRQGKVLAIDASCQVN